MIKSKADRIADKINQCRTMDELDALRAEVANIVEGNANAARDFTRLQQLFIKRKNKIKRHGGRIDNGK